ncbi:hypothetical protein IT774_01055 [Salinimonas marina]|uniref:Uncharacterized protein n=1 Tax=Salinimonas marina TaxID=2785918 RepID=A0A7S9HDF5_9ALTE|nr:hypothetical protein [Salinimonas marina]QPG05887.1 hypothetical protein IT774_01055 [Salinimonas marina]
MKRWIYLLLIGFIAVAAYKYGYYQKLLAVSDKNTQRILMRLQEKPEPDPVQVETLTATAGQSSAAVSPYTGEALADDADSEDRVKEFFTLHPNARSLLLHSVRCNIDGCELTGEFTGQVSEFELMVEQLERQPWWRYGKASQKNATNTAKGRTRYFVLRYQAVVNS